MYKDLENKEQNQELDNTELEDKENNNLEENSNTDLTEFSGEVDANSEEPEVVSEPEPTPMESVVELSTEYNYRSQKFCQLYRMRIKGKSRIINSVFALALIGIGVFTYIKTTNLIFLIISLVVTISPIYNIVCEERRIDKFLVKYFETHPKFTLNYLINEETIRFTQVVDGEEKWADIPWAYVNEVHAVPEYYFLYLNGGNMFILDRNEECLTKGTKKDLDDLILKVTELKPLTVYNKPYCKNFVEVTYFVPEVKQDSNIEQQDNNIEQQDNNIEQEDNNSDNSDQE